MNRRDLFSKGAVALAGIALLPLGILAEQPKKARTPLLKPLDEEVAKCAEIINAGYVEHGNRIFENRHGQHVFQTYDITSGGPRVEQVIFVMHVPDYEAQEDMNGGRLPAAGTFLVMPHGTRVYGVAVGSDDTPESIRRDIVAALKFVQP